MIQKKKLPSLSSEENEIKQIYEEITPSENVNDVSKEDLQELESSLEDIINIKTNHISDKVLDKFKDLSSSLDKISNLLITLSKHERTSTTGEDVSKSLSERFPNPFKDFSKKEEDVTKSLSERFPNPFKDFSKKEEDVKYGTLEDSRKRLGQITTENIQDVENVSEIKDQIKKIFNIFEGFDEKIDDSANNVVERLESYINEENEVKVKTNGDDEGEADQKRRKEREEMYKFLRESFPSLNEKDLEKLLSEHTEEKTTSEGSDKNISDELKKLNKKLELDEKSLEKIKKRGSFEFLSSIGKSFSNIFEWLKIGTGVAAIGWVVNEMVSKPYWGNFRKSIGLPEAGGWENVLKVIGDTFFKFFNEKIYPLLEKAIRSALGFKDDPKTGRKETVLHRVARGVVGEKIVDNPVVKTITNNPFVNATAIGAGIGLATTKNPYGALAGGGIGLVYSMFSSLQKTLDNIERGTFNQSFENPPPSGSTTPTSKKEGKMTSENFESFQNEKILDSAKYLQENYSDFSEKAKGGKILDWAIKYFQNLDNINSTSEDLSNAIIKEFNLQKKEQKTNIETNQKTLSSLMNKLNDISLGNEKSENESVLAAIKSLNSSGEETPTIVNNNNNRRQIVNIEKQTANMALDYGTYSILRSFGTVQAFDLNRFGNIGTYG